MRLSSTVQYEPRYNVEAREQNLDKERQSLEADIGKNGDRMEKVREQTIPALKEQLKNLDKGIFTPYMVDVLKEAHNVTLPGVGPDLAQELTQSPAIAADKEFLRDYIRTLIQSVEAFDAKQTRRGEVLRELTDVTTEKKDRVQNYQEKVQSSDKIVRENLSLLVGRGFHHLGQ